VVVLFFYCLFLIRGAHENLGGILTTFVVMFGYERKKREGVELVGKKG
jgi:hypothetical protein